MSTGGIIELPKGYLKELKAHCEKRGMLLIIDEAQTGMGRTGGEHVTDFASSETLFLTRTLFTDMFAFESDGAVPDILTLSKTLGAGLPLGATVCTQQIEEVCRERGFFYYTTHLNDPLVCAVGAKVCDIAVETDLPGQAAHKGKFLKDGLLQVSRLAPDKSAIADTDANRLQLQHKYPCIGDVRGRGLLLGIEIVLDEAKTLGDQLESEISARCLETGLSCNVVQLPGMGGTFRLAPPVTISE